MPSLTKEEAEARMLIAQAEMFQEQAAHFRKEQEFKAAETREKLAKAISAEHYAEGARINTEAAQRNEQFIKSGNHYHHEFDFIDGVDEESVGHCAAQLTAWHRLDETCPMTIKINSPGGYVIDGMHLFDEISSYSLREWDTRDIPKGTHKTTMIVRGYAASMGGILLQAADHRICGPESAILIHEISSFASGKIGELKDSVKYYEKTCDRVVDIFVRRSGGKITKAKFKRLWDRQDWWLTSEEALEHGFIDEIG